MRISTITNWAYGITLALTAASAVAFMLSADAADRETRAVEQHLTLGEELALGVEERSDAARIYIMGGNQEQLKAFRTDEGEETRREGAIKGIRSAEPSNVELAALDEIERDADALDQIEEKAVACYTAGDKAGAQSIVFGEDHDNYQTLLLESVSVGAAASNRPGLFTGLLQRADTALLEAKVAGRNKTCKAKDDAPKGKVIGLAAGESNQF